MYEANMAMHECDVMINIGARFDDRVTGRLDAFAPNSKKIHIDIDPSNINKTIKIDVPIIGDIESVMNQIFSSWKNNNYKSQKEDLIKWWNKIEEWKKVDCLNYSQGEGSIKPQHAIKRLYELTKDKKTFITTEVGQHQMWAAQYYKFEEPNRWLTSGGLGTMGYGFPAAIGAQIANPDSLVVDIAGDASILMNIQEMSTAVQHRLPVKIFILNNEYMGMVRQWQELLHGGRYSESYTDSLPDFVKLAESFKAKGLRAKNVKELDDVILEMISSKETVIADIWVDKEENCFPMIQSGSAHNEMLLNNLVDNEPGVLARVVGMFSGRGYNIDSLNVAEVNNKNLSRITIVTHGTKEVIYQIQSQLMRIVPVHSVSNLDKEDSSVEAEVALVNMFINEKNKKDAFQICDLYRARKIENENNTVIFEIAGTSQRIDTFIKDISKITDIEIVRSGPVAISSIQKNEEEE